MISHRIESYDSVGQTAVLWSKIPNILAASNKTIYMYYGNSTAPAPPSLYDGIKITVDSTTHNDYGLAYPVTYKFSIPAGSSNLKAYKRYSTGEDWTQITEYQSTDFFNGIEAVRFDYTNNRAYISVAFSSATDEIYLKITNTSNGITDITYQGIPDYYDNRDAAVTVTGDDWFHDAPPGTVDANSNNDTAFKAAADALRARSIWFTAGIVTDTHWQYGWVHPDWADVQEKIDAGYLEIASHTATHNHIPYANYDTEIGTSKGNIIDNLNLPYNKGATDYLYAFLAPFGESDATAHAKVGQYKYLVDRDTTINDNVFTTWDTTNKTYNRIGSSLWLEDSDLVTANNKFDAVVAAKGIYHPAMHPRSIDWTAGSWELQHFDYIKEKTNLWYVGFGHLYLYHYLNDQKKVDVSPASDYPVVYDDFSGAALNTEYWTEEINGGTGTVTVGGGNCTLAPQYGVTNSAAIESVTNGFTRLKAIIKPSTTTSNPYISLSLGTPPIVVLSDVWTYQVFNNGYSFRIKSDTDAKLYKKTNGVFSELAAYTTSLDILNFHEYELIISGSGVRVERDGVTILSSADTTHSSGYALISGGRDNTSANTAVIDWVRMSKQYATPELSATVGLEEPLTAPTVTVQAAGGVTASSVALYGTITDVGTQNATTRGFKYYQSADCTGAENDRSENGDFGAEAYSLNLTSITSNTLFSYKAYATSPAGTGTSSACEAFTTLSSAPTVTVQAASALAQTTATLNGNITAVDGANATERGFNVYNGAVCAGGSIQNPKDTGGSYSTGAFNKGATGLTLNTAYSYAAYAINTGGTGTSGCQSFVTLVNIPDSPTVNYDTATSLTIIINPNLNPAGTLFAIQNVTAGQYVKADGTLQAGEVWQTRAAWGGDSGIINVGLSANTQYNYKVKAKNSADVETVLSDGTVKYTGASDPGAATAIALSSSSIKVDWTSGGAQNKFNVYRDGQSGAGTLIHWADDLTYTDNGLTASTAYTYYVYSVNEDGVENPNFTSATVSTPAVTVPSVITPSPTPSPSVTTAPSSEESAIPQNRNTAKIDYTSPMANFIISQDPSTFVTGKPISFDASGSTDDVKITKYEWDFGDGETSDMVKVNHQYEKPGRYTVTLTVYDKEGNKSVATQTIDIKPSIPTISNITAKGTNLFIEGKSDPDTLVYLTIHSETFNGQGIADKHGYWTYNLENASDIIGQGSHTIFALAAVKLADNSEIRGAESKTYDFNLTVDNGKLKVEMKKTKIWQYVSLGLILLIVVGFVLRRFRKGKLINR